MKRADTEEAPVAAELQRRAGHAEELRRAAVESGLDLEAGHRTRSLLAIAKECAGNPDRFPELVKGCRSLTALEYAQLRKPLAEAAGVSRIGALDEAVRVPSDQGACTPAGLVTIEPCEEPVRVGALLDEVSTFLSRFVHAPRHVHDTVALHVLFGHSLDAFGIAPRLFITAPERECGKSLYLEVIASLSQRSLVASSVSDALLPRVIEKYRPTVLLDEIDTYKLQEREALAGILNSGQRRAAAFAWKVHGDDHEPTPFSTWAPYVFAGIAGKMPDTTRSRCIIVPLGRKPRDIKMEPFRRRQRQEAELVASKVARFATDNMDALRILDERDDSEVMLPKLASDRALDNWRPLLAIGELGGDEWSRRARHAAEVLSGTEPEPEAAGTLLLADLRSLFFNEAGPDSRVRAANEVPKAMLTAVILERLLSDDFQEHPWRDWRKGKPLDAVSLGKLLRPYGVSSANFRIAGIQGKGYSLESLGPVFEQYCSAPSFPQCTDVPTARNSGETRDGLNVGDGAHDGSRTTSQIAAWDGPTAGTGPAAARRPAEQGDLSFEDGGRPEPTPDSGVLV